MNDEQYLAHNKALLRDFSKELCQRTENLPAEHGLRVLAAEFEALTEADTAQLYTQGTSLVGKLFSGHPDFAPTFPRALLWFFGGDCLHFMPDEEIAVYQQLDEQRRSAAQRGEIIDLQAARAKLLKLQ